MDSLSWVDQTNMRNHPVDRSVSSPKTAPQSFYTNLESYPPGASRLLSSGTTRSPIEGAKAFIFRSGRKAFISLAVYGLSFLPVVGRFVLPAASFYTFRQAVGKEPAFAIFAVGLLLPRAQMVMFLQAYFGSRSLMRELVSLERAMAVQGYGYCRVS